MSLLPKALRNTIESLSKLPGVGPRSAERYTLALLKKDKHQVQMIAESIAGLHDGVAYCEKTFALTEPDEPISKLYSDPERDKTCGRNRRRRLRRRGSGEHWSVHWHLPRLRRADQSALDNIGPDQLTIQQLVMRIDDDQGKRDYHRYKCQRRRREHGAIYPKATRR
jgi:recombination protein RecR